VGARGIGGSGGREKSANERARGVRKGYTYRAKDGLHAEELYLVNSEMEIYFDSRQRLNVDTYIL
jgi:hypothetical protein